MHPMAGDPPKGYGNSDTASSEEGAERRSTGASSSRASELGQNADDEKVERAAGQVLDSPVASAPQAGALPARRSRSASSVTHSDFSLRGEMGGEASLPGTASSSLPAAGGGAHHRSWDSLPGVSAVVDAMRRRRGASMVGESPSGGSPASTTIRHDVRSREHRRSISIGREVDLVPADISCDIYDQAIAGHVAKGRYDGTGTLARGLFAERARFKEEQARVKFDQAVAKRAPIALWPCYAEHLTAPETASAFFSASLNFCLRVKHLAVPDDLVRALMALGGASGECGGGGAGAAAAGSVDHPSERTNQLQRHVLEAIVSTGDYGLVHACFERLGRFSEGRFLGDALVHLALNRLQTGGKLREEILAETSREGNTELFAGARGRFVDLMHALERGFITQWVVEGELGLEVTRMVRRAFTAELAFRSDWQESLRCCLDHHTPTCAPFEPLSSDMARYHPFRDLMSEVLDALDALRLPDSLCTVLAARRERAEALLPGSGVPAAMHLFATMIYGHWPSCIREVGETYREGGILERLNAHLLAMAIRAGKRALGEEMPANEPLTVDKQHEMILWERNVHRKFFAFIERVSAPNTGPGDRSVQA